MAWIHDFGKPDFWEKYEMCTHCNGYGSSLKESSSTCTECGGSGLKERNEGGGDQECQTK